MKKLYKINFIALIMVMLLIISGCGSNDNKDNSGSKIEGKTEGKIENKSESNREDKLSIETNTNIDNNANTTSNETDVISDNNENNNNVDLRRLVEKIDWDSYDVKDDLYIFGLNANEIDINNLNVIGNDIVFRKEYEDEYLELDELLKTNEKIKSQNSKYDFYCDFNLLWYRSDITSNAFKTKLPLVYGISFASTKCPLRIDEALEDGNFALTVANNSTLGNYLAILNAFDIELPDGDLEDMDEVEAKFLEILDKLGAPTGAYISTENTPNVYTYYFYWEREKYTIGFFVTNTVQENSADAFTATVIGYGNPTLEQPIFLTHDAWEILKTHIDDTEIQQKNERNRWVNVPYNEFDSLIYG